MNGARAPTGDEWKSEFDRLQIRIARPDDPESIASGAADVLVAENDTGLVGAAVASFDGWRAYMYHVAVDPVSRHHGVAGASMGEVQSILARKGARAIYVLEHEANTQGLALVAAAGYQPDLGELVPKREIPAPVLAWS